MLYPILTSRRWRTRLTLAAVLLIGFAPWGPAQSPPAGYPPFSWNTVPVAADVVKSPDQFTDAEASFIANNFSFIAIDKGQGVPKNSEYAEQGFETAVSLIKQYKTQMKILYYWSTNVGVFLNQCEAMYEALNNFQGSWCEPAPSHSPSNFEWPCGTQPTWTSCKMSSNTGTDSPLYYLANLEMPEAFKQWWATSASGVVSTDENGFTADGVLADSTPPSSTPNVESMYRTLTRKLPANSLLMYNGIQCGAAQQGAIVCPDFSTSLTYLRQSYMSGAMFEHFGLIDSDMDPKNTVALQSAMNHLISLGNENLGKIILFKGWPQPFSQWTPLSTNTYSNEVTTARGEITFPLACFLAVAQPYWYFQYSWGYREPNAGVLTYFADPKTGENTQKLDTGWYPEFFQLLGEPDTTEPTVSGTQYTRTFAQKTTTVTRDVANPSLSSIAWSNSQSRRYNPTPPAAR